MPGLCLVNLDLSSLLSSGLGWAKNKVGCMIEVRRGTNQLGLRAGVKARSLWRSGRRNDMDHGSLGRPIISWVNLGRIGFDIMVQTWFGRPLC